MEKATAKLTVTNNKKITVNSKCPKCGRRSLITEHYGWAGAKPRIVCVFAGCGEVIVDDIK